MPRVFKFYDLLMAAFVTCLLCSNLIGVDKPFIVAGFSFSAATIFFPISYLLGDILTEVYGYARSRRVVWVGFAALLFASIMSLVVVAVPSAPGFTGQAAMEKVFGVTPRMTAGSMLAYLIGELINSFTLAKLKVAMSGRLLWVRTLGSSILGELVDTLIFYPVALYGVLDDNILLTVMIGDYFLKIFWEILATPLTYLVINFLKRVETEDFYDRDTRFNPFNASI